MWKIIKISERTYLMNCIFGFDDAVTLILYDHKESWFETLTLEKLKQKARLLNRRYDYSEEIVRDTLARGELESATLEQNDFNRTDKMALKLKYLVKKCPFNYEWTLKKQTIQEIQTTFVRPLCSALLSSQEQVDILIETLKKKDAEILQYRKEGAILSRKTLATKLFDFDEFEKKYDASNKIAAEFKDLEKLWHKIEPKSEVKPTESVQEKKSASPEAKLSSSLTRPTITPWSPGQRKRKIQELKQKHLERNLKTRKQNITYESSQSQDASTGSSDSTEVNVKVEKPKPRPDAAKSPLKNQPRARLRSSSIDTPVKTHNHEIEELKQKHLERNLKTRKQNIPNESSQNQDVSTGSSGPTEVNVKVENPKSRPDTKSPQKNQPRARLRSSSIDTAMKTHNHEIQELKQKQQERNLKTRKENVTYESSQNQDVRTGSSEPTKVNVAVEKPKSRPDAKSPQKIQPRARLRSSSIDTESDCNKISQNAKKITRRRRISSYDESDNDNTNTITRNSARLSALRNVIVEISTDSEYSESDNRPSRRYPKRRNTTSTPTKNSIRITRSSPQSSAGADGIGCRRRRNSVGMMSADFKIFDTPTKSQEKMSSDAEPVVGEISSQLSAIRKELESLEALRLADLKQRKFKP